MEISSLKYIIYLNDLEKTTWLYNRDVKLILEMSSGPKFPARPGPQLFCSGRPGINILKDLYNGLYFILFLWGGGAQTPMKILLSTG